MASLNAIRRALASAAVEPEPPSRAMAAVAMAFAGRPDALTLCFILRATREGDRWSGQMAFPGGKAEPFDASAQAVAIREAREEVDLRLEHAELLGALPSVPLRPAGVLGVMQPFGFYLGAEPPRLRPHEDEVAQAFWIPVEHLWDERNRGSIDWEHQGQRWRFPGIRFGEHVIWGLTHRVLTHWAEGLGRPLPTAGDPPRVLVG